MTLGASSAGYLPLVTLSGRVGSDTPIVGEQSGLEAVIVENNVTSGFTWNVY
jgi:E3 ubiquitin-protein ligase MUL1